MKFQNITLQRKINLLLGTLVVVMLGLSGARLYYIVTSRENFDHVAQTSRSAATSAKALYVASNQLEALIPELNNATNSDDISHLRRRLNRIIDNATLAANTGTSTDSIGAALRTQLGILSRQKQSALAARRELLRAEVNLADAQAKILDAAAQVQLSSRQLHTEWLAKTLDTIPTESQRNYDRVLRETELILRLNLQLTNLLTLSKTIATSADPTASLAGMSQSAATFSASVRDLAKLPDSPARSSLVSGLHTLHSAIGGAHGFQDTALAFERVNAGYHAALNELMNSLGATTAAIGDAVATLERETSKQSELFSHTATLAIQGETFLNLAFGGAIVLAVWWVFHHQVIRRMEALCKDVVKLAAGDLDSVPQITGSDEIGRVGEALKVFRQNARELRRSNDDLANFAYVASHDLRSPLRAIRDLVTWTLEDHGATLRTEVRENLEMICGRADRLSRLLNDLLDYARVDHSHSSLALLDMQTIVRDISEIVDPDDVSAISYSGDRFFHAAETPLRTILINLVSNAIKHHDKERGLVQIKTHVQDNHVTITVQDDGPGIEQKYQDKVWELFQTLGDGAQVDASGLGLAMVRKLVDALEGTIQLQSNPDIERGTVFTLNIPIRSKLGAESVADISMETGAA